MFKNSAFSQSKFADEHQDKNQDQMMQHGGGQAGPSTDLPMDISYNLESIEEAKRAT